MKTKVVRQLTGGVYFVNFTFSEFTQDEIAKMSAFGVPVIEVQYGPPHNRFSQRLAITQVNANFNPGFTTQEEAKTYEQSVLEQVRAAMEELRKRKDDFSSSDEVSI